MGMQVIPSKYIHTCDMCHHSVESAGTNKPHHWADVKVDKDSYDYQDCPVASGAYALRLCGNCLAKVEGYINDAAKEAASHD